MSFPNPNTIQLTVDDLLRELMKIKEIYPNGGNFKVYHWNDEWSDEVETTKVIKNPDSDEILIR